MGQQSLAQETFEEVVEIKRNISLENAFGGGVTITTDRNGDFIVTNAKLNRISSYNTNGNFLFGYGKEGKGPGDFLRPMSTIRLSSGQLLTGELTGKLSLFTARGDSVLKIYNVKILPLTEIHQIDKKKILLVGRKRYGNKIKLLHIFDLSKGTIRKSFLELPFSLQEYGGVFGSLASLPTATVKDGEIAAVIGPFPQIKLFNYEGNLKDSLTLSLEFFKKIQELDRKLSRQELDEYITTFSVIDKIYWLKNNTLLLSYFQYTNFKFPNERKKRNSLVNIKLDGTVLFEIKDSPVLKSVYSSNSSSLFFENSDFQSNVNLSEGKIKEN